MNNYTAKELDIFKRELHFDIRSEVFFNALSKNNFSDSDIRILFDGIFYRKFNKDIIAIDEDVHDTAITKISLSRDGFYHTLPEGIVHDYRSIDKKTDPVEAYKQRKKEEENAKYFFSPLENEFFRFRYMIEELEEALFQQMNTHGIADVVKEILGVDTNMPDTLVIKLFALLMQEKSFISGDIFKIQKALQAIIQERVSITSKYITIEPDVHEKPNKEPMILGINSTLQHQKEIYLKRYHFIIGPLNSSSQLLDYIFNGTMKGFLEVFFNLLLPFHTQFSYEIDLNENDQMFVLKETAYNSRLGISTVL